MKANHKKPWLKPNGLPLSDSKLKACCRSWDDKTWEAYLRWYERPCRETLIHSTTYDRICEGRTQSLHEELGTTTNPGLSNYCEHLLSALPLLEAKVLGLHYLEGLTELEIARRIRKTQSGVSRIKKRAISKLSARNSNVDVMPIHIMKGLDFENEMKTPSPWDDSCPLSIRQKRPYLPENWRSELQALVPEFLQKSLHGFSEDQLRIVYLRFWCDGSCVSIARELGLGVNVVQEICEATVFKIKSRVEFQTKSELGVQSCA